MRNDDRRATNTLEQSRRNLSETMRAEMRRSIELKFTAEKRFGSLTIRRHQPENGGCSQFANSEPDPIKKLSA